MGGKQFGFSDYELTTAKKKTKREKFLSEMEVVVLWQALIAPGPITSLSQASFQPVPDWVLLEASRS
jgi:hypothetical protein